VVNIYKNFECNAESYRMVNSKLESLNVHVFLRMDSTHNRAINEMKFKDPKLGEVTESRVLFWDLEIGYIWNNETYTCEKEIFINSCTVHSLFKMSFHHKNFSLYER
jgi:hypothetical protein